MIKTAYNAVGYITAVLPKNSGTVTFDSALYAILNTLLGIGDWTYLTLDDGDRVEVIKVYRIVAARLDIVRGQDNTIAQNFLPQTSVYYELTSAEIVDKLGVGNLQLLGYGGILVVGTEVAYGPIIVDTIGGMDVIVSHEQIHLDWKKQNQTCCELLNPGAAQLGPPFEYLTSVIYPVEDIEALTSALTFVGGYLYTETVDALTAALIITTGTLRLILHRTTAPPDALTSALVLQSGIIHTVLIRTTAPPDALTSALVLQSGVIHTVLIRNTKEPDALTSALTLISGSLL